MSKTFWLMELEAIDEDYLDGLQSFQQTVQRLRAHGLIWKDIVARMKELTAEKEAA